jgi:aryl-alcohol dehydrogenase-like predicted oxidoreductase
VLTRPLPGTDLQVSALGFGCWTIGGEYWGDDVDDERSIAAVRTAYACGITLFDTAPLYGRGHADELLVRALGERRHDVAIATKVGVRLDLAHARSDLRPEHVVADAEASLRRLKLPALPLLQVHWPCEEGTPLDDTVAALEGLVDRGDVRYWGLCNFGPQAVRQARGAVVLQTPYSLLRREFEGELAAAVAERDLGVFAYEPLCRGLLTGKFRAPRTFPDSDLRSRDDRFTGPWFARSRPLIEGLEAVGQKLGVPTAAVALAWVADRPHVTAALVGARSPEQVRANVQAVRLLGKPRIRAVLERLGDSWSG